MTYIRECLLIDLALRYASFPCSNVQKSFWCAKYCIDVVEEEGNLHLKLLK